MNHFPIVQAICRAALADASPALRKQVERLRDALQKEGEGKQAGSLTSLLTAAERAVEIAPSRIEKSRGSFIVGETLTRNTPVPVDRETAAPLADIIFPDERGLAEPLFEPFVADAIHSMIEEWTHSDALVELGVRPARSCLLFGAPGTGKTHLALWIARQLQVPTILVKLDGLVSSFLGTTARNIGNLFAFANRYRCVLLLDEFDAIAKVRDDPHEVGEIKRVVNALLQNLDGRQNAGFTIGITNHSALLDPAVWRRFDLQIEIPKPSFDIRKELAEQFLAPLAIPAPHLDLIAWCTEGASGAEVEILARTYKKAKAVPAAKPASLIDTLRRFATLNSARIDKEHRQILFDDDVSLYQVLHEDPRLKFSYADVGEIVGVDKTTIIRRIEKAQKIHIEEQIHG